MTEQKLPELPVDPRFKGATPETLALALRKKKPPPPEPEPEKDDA